MSDSKLMRDPTISALFALIFACFSLTALATPADDLREANRNYQQGKLDIAMAMVNTLLSAQPRDAQGRFLKGLILTEQKKVDEAIHVFTGLTEDFPQLPEPFNNLAVLYASQGNYEKAKAALERAIHTHPSYATAHENLGDIYAQLARRAYDKALALDKSNTTALAKLAMVKDLFSPPKSTLATQGTQVAAAAVSTQPNAANPEKAVTPVISKTQPPSPQDEEKQIRGAVEGWAKAWSDKDAATYLAFYAPDFAVPDGLSRNLWEKQRRERIDRPKSISVSVTINAVSIKGTEALVKMHQNYRSDTLKSQNNKILRMIKTGERWLIVEERVG